jgi:hypothetical protein
MNIIRPGVRNASATEFFLIVLCSWKIFVRLAPPSRAQPIKKNTNVVLYISVVGIYVPCEAQTEYLSVQQINFSLQSVN